MRGSFNTTCDVFNGPNAAVLPNALRLTCPCRLVIADGIEMVGPFHPNRFAWCTLDAGIPIGSWGPQAGILDPGLADQFAIPAGSGRAFWCLYTDEIIWDGRPPYFRANLVPLPIPLGFPPITVPNFGVAIVLIGKEIVSIPLPSPNVIVGNDGGSSEPFSSGGILIGSV